MTFGERLNSLIIALEAKNITSFEDRVGVSRKIFSKVIKEGTDTGCKNVLKIWENFPNVNLHWLLTGSGDMFIDVSDALSLILRMWLLIRLLQKVILLIILEKNISKN